MNRRGFGLAGLCLIAAIFAGDEALAQKRRAAPRPDIWVGAWATSQQVPEPENALPREDFTNATVRQIVHLTLGGSQLRVRFSNTFGLAPLHIKAAHIARALSASSPAIDPASDRALSFSGRADVVIPAGAEYLSDPVSLPVKALSSLAISFYVEQAPEQQTSHPGSRTDSYFTHGDLVSAADLPGAGHVAHWYQIAGVDVKAPAGAQAIVTLGDSITDGRGSTTNGNDRWPDALAARLQQMPATRMTSVLNHGIGGNRLLQDGKGQNVLARFDRDVLAQTGVRHLIVLEGINDLGTLTLEKEVSVAEHEVLVRRIIGAYQQIIARAHAHGIRVYGATITPVMGMTYYHPTAQNEADRQAVNAWIRKPGNFDAVIDFDAVIRDPARPDRLLPAYDSGDLLHPSPAGYRAMAAAIPLSLFTSRAP